MPRTSLFPSLVDFLSSKRIPTSVLLEYGHELLEQINKINIQSANLCTDPSVEAMTVANQMIFEQHFGPKIGIKKSSLATIIAYANTIEKYHYGNCVEMSIYGFVLALQGLLHNDKLVATKLKIVYFGFQQSHFAVEIQHRDESIILDPWSGVVFPKALLAEIQAFELLNRGRGYPSTFSKGIYGKDLEPYTYFELNMDTGYCYSIAELRMPKTVEDSTRQKHRLMAVEVIRDLKSQDDFMVIKHKPKLLHDDEARLRAFPRAGLAKTILSSEQLVWAAYKTAPVSKKRDRTWEDFDERIKHLGRK